MLIQNIGAAAPAWFASEGAPAPAAISAAQAGVPQPAGKPDAPTSADVKDAVDHINKVMQQSNASVEFSVDKDTKQTVIKVLESGTGTLIRQFPTETALAIARVIGQQTHSLLVDQKA